MPDHYYVTVIDGKRVGWLAGPFGARCFADEALPEAREAANKFSREGAEGRAFFYAYGVTRVRDADASRPRKVVFPSLGAHRLELQAREEVPA